MKIHSIIIGFWLIIASSFNVINSQIFIPEANLYPAGQGSVSWGDYNNNGYPDILLTGWDGLDASAKIIDNNGGSSFSASAAVMTGVISSSVVWGDFNNDGDVDALITGSKSGVTLDAISKLYLNTGGSFSELASGLPGMYNGCVSIADQDRDGDLDILMTGMITTAERVSRIYNNDGTGVFTVHSGTSFIPLHKGFSAFCDYDNDGYPDIFINGETATLSRVSKIYHNNADGTYSELEGITLKGMAYGSGAWTEINGDGYIDLIITGEDASFAVSTKIYINNKSGGFTEQTGNEVGGIKKGKLSYGDIDNDGDNDLIITGERSNSGITEVYLNDGSGHFTKSNIENLEGAYQSSVSLADFDNDDDLDLLLSGYDNSDATFSKLYKNQSTTTYNDPAKPLNLGYEINKSDIKLTWDKISGGGPQSASISYNVRIGLSAASQEIVSAQSDITGKRKIVDKGNAHFINYLNHKFLRWNTDYYASVQAIDNSFNGGPFSDPVTFKITPQQPVKLTGSNFNTTSIQLRWLRGNGDRCILFAREGAAGPATPVNNTTYFANSFFGEGSPIGSTGWYCIYKGEADSVLLSGLDPGKDYTVYAIEFQGAQGSEIYATETNPDNDNIGVFSSGIFTTLSGISMIGLGGGSIAWGDYDNDGYLDILSTGQKVGGEAASVIYRNNGDNTFTQQTGISILGVFYSSCAWGDYNDDDLLDFVISGYNQSSGAVTRIYKNNGDNTFTWQNGITLAGITYSSAGWADYDNDGDIDLLISGQNLSTGVLTKLYRNDGNNSFTEQNINFKGLYKGSLAWGDYNNDGRLDVILSGIDGITSNSNNYTGIYKNNGDGTFSEQTEINLTGVSYSSVKWGDYDNDNYLDILLTGMKGYSPDYVPVTKVYHNNNDETFTELTGLSVKNVGLSSAEWGDYNNDGFLDILVTGDSGNNLEFSIYLNNGQNSFVDLSTLTIPGSYYSSTSSADYDSDGDLDILYTGNNGTYSCEIYRNNLYMMAGKVRPNEKPEAPTDLLSEVRPGTLKFSWSGIETDETWFVNMSYNVRAKRTSDDKWKVTPHSSSAGFRSLNALGNSQLNRNFTILNPESGTYLWQVQAVDQSYSGSEWSEIDTVIIKKTQAFFKTDTVCHGSVTKFTDQSVVTDGIASWKWDFTDGTTSILQNPEHKFFSAGNFNVKLTVTSNAGDKDSLTQKVVVKAKPVTQFTAPNVCIGTASTITNTTALNALSINSWEWSFGDGQTSAAQNPGTHAYAIKGTYSATLKAFASNGCADSITKNIIVAGFPEKALSTDKPLVFCAGDSVVLTADYDTLYTYQWQMDNNNITGAIDSTFSVKNYSASYSVIITNTLANCVTMSDPKVVTIKENPAEPAIVSDNYKSEQCLKDSPIKLRVDQAATGVTYEWLRNGVKVNEGSYIEGYLDPGIYIVSADINGCKKQSKTFSVNNLGAPEKPTIIAKGPTVWYLSSSVPASRYNWYFNGNLIPGASQEFYIAYQNYGVYQLSIGNSNGCFSRSDTIVIPLKTGLTGIEDIDPFSELKIYPNPTTGVFTIEMNNDIFGELIIDILNRYGAKSLNIKFKKSTSHFMAEIDLSGQGKGMYLVSLSLDKYRAVRKLVIE